MKLTPRLVPGDVREVIDRTDERLTDMVERLAVIGELLSEQNMLLSTLIRQNGKGRR